MIIRQLLAEQTVALSAAERDALAREVLDETFGLGPLEPLLARPPLSATSL